MIEFSAVKKNKILPIVTSGVDLEGIMLSEIVHTEKQYHMIYIICRINKLTNKKLKFINSETEWWFPEVQDGVGKMDTKGQRYTFPVIK